jgi:hypothetical protein
VFFFWTGDSVTGVITREGAEGFRKQSGHRLILWDNYPVNDSQPTLHLGPLTKRDPDLNEVVDGYMSNPMHKENQINRIPLYTCADYAWNPRAYDPGRSIGQAMLRLGDTKEQREVLRDMVELYPGFVLWGGGTGTNATVERLHRILAIPHSRCAARAYVDYARSVATRMAAAFPEKYVPARRRLEADIEGMEAVLASQ